MISQRYMVRGDDLRVKFNAEENVHRFYKWTAQEAVETADAAFNQASPLCVLERYQSPASERGHAQDDRSRGG